MAKDTETRVPADSALTAVVEIPAIATSTKPLNTPTTNPENPIEQDLEITSPSQTRTSARLTLVLIGLNLTAFVVALNSTIVATAAASITSHFHSAAGYQWIGGAYLLAAAAAAPIWVALSDIWGRKLILLSACALFFFSSLVCAQAVSMGMLIVGRAVQGVAGAGLNQMVIVVMADLFSVRKRSLMIGLMEVMWCIAGGVGPIIGGSLAERNWRWIFYLNLPVVGTVSAILLLFLDVHNPRTKFVEGFKAIDWFGSLTIIGFTLMLLLGLDFGGTLAPWNSPKVICLIVFGSLMSLFFIYAEKRIARLPIMPLHIFKNRSNTAAILVGFLHGFVQISGEYYLPLYLQSTKGFSPLHAGFLTLPLLVGAAATAMVCGIYMSHTGRFLELLWIGTSLLALGTGMYIAFSPSTSLVQIIFTVLIGGAGAGSLFSPPLIALQALVKQEDTAKASATFGFLRAMASAMSIVIGGVIVQNGMEDEARNLQAAGLPAEMVEHFSGREALANVLRVPQIENLEWRHAVESAYARGLRGMWIMLTVLAVLGVVASGFVSKAALKTEHTETVTGLKRREEVVPLAAVEDSGENVERP